METPEYILLFRKECKFLLGVRKYEAIPDFNLPEVAFWGKSNVGKSSLINTLLNRVKLVKVAKTPGKTKEINFFNLNKQLIISDLPGYGYALVDKTTKAEWHDLVIDYLAQRPPLKRIYLLIDARHGIKANDVEIMKFLDRVPKSYMVVLTKSDKVSKFELEALQQTVENLLKKHGAAYPKVIISSSKNKIAIDDLRNNIFELML